MSPVSLVFHTVVEWLLLGFLKEDLFYFFSKIIFSEIFTFAILLLCTLSDQVRYTIRLGQVHYSTGSYATLSSNIVSEPCEFLFICFQLYTLVTWIMDFLSVIQIMVWIMDYSNELFSSRALNGAIWILDESASQILIIKKCPITERY